jgi:hypothetical protein
MLTDVRRLRVGLLALSLSACNGSTSYLDATGVAGKEEATLGWWLTGISLAVVVFVCIAILLGIARHRGESNAPGGDVQTARQGATTSNRV